MAKEKLTEQQKLEKRKIHRTPTFLFRFMSRLSKFLYYKKCGVSYTYNIDLKPFRGKPYVVVSNHASRLDHAFTAPAFYPDTFNFVVGYNEFFRSHLAFLMRALQVIPKKNFVPYPYAVKQITRVIKQGGRIIIMPEGMSSISGANQPCAVGSGQLFKYLGVPVLYTKISGGYLTSTKYCLDERPGRVDVVVDQLFTPEQLKTMTADEIQAELDRKLWHDDYEWNKTARARYDGHGELARNLHQLLFRCPKCGGMLCMESAGNTIRCKVCGNEATLNEYYDLIPKDKTCVIPDTPRVWFDEQRAQIRNMVAEDGFLLAEQVKIGMLPKYGYLKHGATSEIVGEGTLVLDREGIHYDGTKDGAPFSFSIGILQLPTYGMCTDVSRFYTFYQGDFIEFYPERESAELWMMATEEMHRLCGGAWKDFPEKALV